MDHLITVYLLFSCLSLTEANSVHLPRMIFTDKETVVKTSPVAGHRAPVRILLKGQRGQQDTVTAVGQTHLSFYNFQNPEKTPTGRKVQWKECINNDCNYNITVVHQREDAEQIFVIGTNGRETVCCDMNISEQSSTCIPSEKMLNIRDSIREFPVKEGEQSALVESEQSTDLYITRSGVQKYDGIHKFGTHRVRPDLHDEEQHYVGLVVSRRRDDPLQDRVYAFYKQKNRDKELDSEMWIPFVTQVCMADVGGPKNNLQFCWTSQMNARLFCGDPDSKQHFSELVDMATVHADRWQDTKVYALFRNEWGMSAVCVYTIQDIHNVFSTSAFKGSTTENPMDRPRTCVRDSTKIPLDILRKIDKISEMEEWVQPAENSGPLLFNHHNYSHIYVDSSQHHTIMFLSLNNGAIHKVMQHKNDTFIIAEYRPFNHRAHILNVILHPPSRKLYVNSRSEVVQLDVANCAQYGNTCEDCILSRDPYCRWKKPHCTQDTSGTWQDVAGGNHSKCVLPSHLPLSGNAYRYSTDDPQANKNVVNVTLPSQARYFLQCPVSSRHATYTWRSNNRTTPCDSKEDQCLLLIDSMGSEQVGPYKCVSEEMGHSKVLAQYRLQLENRAVGQLSSPMVWVCLVVVLMKSLSH